MPAKALIIVDMLNDFIDKNGALYCGDTVLPIVPLFSKGLSHLEIEVTL
jgi:nicotinamidase-related amidase